MVASQVSLCSRSTSPKSTHELFADLGGRLRSLAELHRLLATQLDSDLFEDQCRSICLYLVRSLGREDVVPWVRMEDLPLDRGQRLRIALLVAELLTNVLKHSLLDDYGGTVWIDLRSCKGGVELSVSDSGKTPAPCAPPSRIVSALVQSLSGHPRVIDRGGCTVSIRFPLAPLNHAVLWSRPYARFRRQASD